jgi:hypothetical protein
MPANPSQFMSNTEAPPGGTPAVDLNEAFGDMTIHPSSKAVLKPSSSRNQEPHRQSSSSASKVHESSRQPSSKGSPRDHTHQSSTGDPNGSPSRRTHSNPLSTVREEVDGRVTITQKTKKKGLLRGLFGGNEETSVSITTPSRLRSRSHTSHSLSNRTHHSSSTHHRTSHGSSSRRHENSKQPSSSSTSRRTHAAEDPKSSVQAEKSRMPVGNMERTYLEGMEPATQYANTKGTNLRGMVPSSEYAKNRGTYPSATHMASVAPSNIKSVFQNENDIKMASRQTHYASMEPEEKRKQERWAQGFLKRTSVCPEGYEWTRRRDGYQCEGRSHYTTDEQIQEGKSGCYSVHPGDIYGSRAGPYYPDPNDADYYTYCGPDPRPHRAPHRLGPSTRKARREREQAMQMAGVSRFHFHGSGMDPRSQALQQSMMHSGLHSGRRSHGHSSMLGPVVHISSNGVTTRYGTGVGY